jgi:hypothetical protein
MNFTLDICGDKTVQNPTEADIRSAVGSLNAKKGDAFLILDSGTAFIQTSGDAKVGFDLEYREFNAAGQYRATRDFTADEIVAVFGLFLNASGDWKKMAQWERIDD